MRKRIVQIIFILLTVFTLWYIDGVLCIKSMHGVDQARGLYFQPRDSVDVVMMGSSHVHCDIDIAVLWKEYGIAAYDYSAAEQPLWGAYHYLKEFVKYQDPKVVVLELYSPARFKDDYQYAWLPENLCGMRFSLNKLQLLKVSAEPDKYKEFFPDFVYYHDRIFSLEPYDFSFPFRKYAELPYYKGFTPFYERIPQEKPVHRTDECSGLTDKSELYLNRIIEYTKSMDIELYLLVSPYIMMEEDEKTFNRIKEIADENGIPFWNANMDYDLIGLDFDEDFNDLSHLNYWGAVKYTHLLGKKLKERYDIPDRRNDKKYHTWQKYSEGF
ncbi:MAG: hypothetical protein K6E53_01450 [Lachnospiraceae bacterium]|nr:hypothetical protein [Lachnospiraceae bacterium]